MELLCPRQRAEDLLALLQRVPRADTLALDAERHVGHESDRQVAAGRVGGVALAVGERPVGGHAPVVEDRFADEVDVDVALEAQHGAHEHVVAVLVRRRAGVRRDGVLLAPRAHRQSVTDEHPARRRVPGRQQGVRAGLVDPGRGHVEAEWAEAEGAGLPVQQRSEHARRVEARDAEPVDGAVGCDEGAGVAVGQERVVGDRRERRRRGRALGSAARRGGGGHDATHGPCQPPWLRTSSSAAAGPHVPFA